MLFERERPCELGTRNERRDWLRLATFRAIVIEGGTCVKIVCATSQPAFGAVDGIRSEVCPYPQKGEIPPRDSVKRFAYHLP